MQELVGKKIVKVEVGDNEYYLRFTDHYGNTCNYYAEGDCCSVSWFSEIINLDYIINHTITEVEVLDMPKHYDNNTRQEHDKFYGYRIATEAGHCTIAFRNSSNGYYGGWCALTTYDDCKNWTDISNLADWTAYEKTSGSYFQMLKLKAFW